MIKTIVVAIAKNHAIGKDNDLLWRLPGDLKFFKETTKGHHLIMGRKTYESLGKPLPLRTTIVITRNDNFSLPEGHHVVKSLEGAISLAEEKGLKEVMILGGGQIYQQALEENRVDQMIITEVQATFKEADTFFPEFDKNIWKETNRIKNQPDEKNAYAYDFVTYRKINNELEASN